MAHVDVILKQFSTRRSLFSLHVGLHVSFKFHALDQGKNQMVPMISTFMHLGVTRNICFQIASLGLDSY